MPHDSGPVKQERRKPARPQNDGQLRRDEGQGEGEEGEREEGKEGGGNEGAGADEVEVEVRAG